MSYGGSGSIRIRLSTSRTLDGHLPDDGFARRCGFELAQNQRQLTEEVLLGHVISRPGRTI